MTQAEFAPSSNGGEHRPVGHIECSSSQRSGDNAAGRVTYRAMMRTQQITATKSFGLQLTRDFRDYRKSVFESLAGNSFVPHASEGSSLRDLSKVGAVIVGVDESSRVNPIEHGPDHLIT